MVVVADRVCGRLKDEESLMRGEGLALYYDKGRCLAWLSAQNREERGGQIATGYTGCRETMSSESWVPS